MEFYIVITVVLFAIGLWNLLIAILGCFPQCRATAVGTLVKANTKRNVRGFKNSTIPISTDYVYTYTVKGKLYKYTANQRRTKRNLFRKVSMIYVKWFPRHAYPNKFTGANEWVAGIFMMLFGILFTWAIVKSQAA